MMTDINALEYSTLKVPYEILNKRFRTAQKTIDREASHVQQLIENLETIMKDEPVSVINVKDNIQSLIEKTELFKQRVNHVFVLEKQSVDMLKCRLDNLEKGAEWEGNGGNWEQWRRQRVSRLIVEFLLRAGCYQAAQAIASHNHLLFMCNYETFMSAKQVEDSLKQHQLNKCLNWTHENKSKLRRLKSRLELTVRIQEFVELVREGKKESAVEYGRKYFGSVADVGWEGELQRVMALLTVGVDTDVVDYGHLLADDRWQQLIGVFCEQNAALYQLTRQSAFSACFQSGLSSLKTPQCRLDQEPLTDKGCPVCHAAIHCLAEPLPFAHAAQSRLVCAFSGQPLNENNPPMMLPNGMVYGQKAIEALQINGRIICPRSGDLCTLDEVVRVFVM